jgi:hypothetical protein
MTDAELKELAELRHKWGCSDITPTQLTRLAELENKEAACMSK